MVRQDSTTSQPSKDKGRKFFLREAEDKTGLGLLLLEGPSHVETVLKSTFSDPGVKMNHGLYQILTKVGREIWPIFRRMGWRSRPHKTIIGQFTFTAPGYTSETGVEGVTKYDTYGALGKAFLEEGDERMVQRAEQGNQDEEKSVSDTSEVDTINEEEDDKVVEAAVQHDKANARSFSQNFPPNNISRTRSTNSAAYISPNIESVLKKTLSDPEVKENPSMEPLLNKVGLKVWPIFKKVGWRSRPHITILGESTFTAPGFTLEKAIEGVTKYSTYSALGKAFLEEGDEKMLARAQEAEAPIEQRSPSEVLRNKQVEEERERKILERPPRENRTRVRSSSITNQIEKVSEESEEEAIDNQSKGNFCRITSEENTILEENEEEEMPQRENQVQVRPSSQGRKHFEEGFDQIFGRPQRENLTNVPSTSATYNNDIGRAQSYDVVDSKSNRSNKSAKHRSDNDSYSESVDDSTEVLANGETLPALSEVPPMDDGTSLIELMPIPRSRSTPVQTTDSLAARLELLEVKMLEKLAEEEETVTSFPSKTPSPSPSKTSSPSTIPSPSKTLSPSKTTKEPIQSKNVVTGSNAETSPSNKSTTSNQAKKSSLNTRVEAMEELVFDDGQPREGKIVSRIKDMESFIFDGNYSPPLNLTARVNALAQEFELDI